MSQDIFFISAFRACSLFGSRANQATSLHSFFLSLWVCAFGRRPWGPFLPSKHSHTPPHKDSKGYPADPVLSALIDSHCLRPQPRDSYVVCTCVFVRSQLCACVCAHTRELHHCKSKYWLYCFHDLLIPSSVLFEIILCLHIDIQSLCVYMIVRTNTVKESCVTPGTLMAGNELGQSTKEKQSAVALTCPNTHL